MTDLTAVLPGFPAQKYARLLPSLEKNLITTSDLITLDPSEIAKRAQLPTLDTKALCRAVLEALHQDLGFRNDSNAKEDGPKETLRKSGHDAVAKWQTISTLDDALDQALGGGIPTGYITEVTGESGAGKTQFLLTLLLSTQLPSPHGLSRPTIYISTESALPTTRLSQLLTIHPLLSTTTPRPSLDHVISICTPDLESQDHILRYQLPVAIRRHNAGLVILDSVAANYRAEFERAGASWSGANMAKRSGELVKLGLLLREVARTEGCAVVVANQVADRFAGSSERGKAGSVGGVVRTQSSPAKRMGATSALVDTMPLASSPGISGTQNAAAELGLVPPHVPSSSDTDTDTAGSSGITMTLDHQQRWFTGWGDSPQSRNLKTPSLGLIWTNQIACRVALIKYPVYGRPAVTAQETERGEPILRRWRRWMKVVFAPWARPTGAGLEGAVEFEILGGGLRALGKLDG